MSARSKPRKAWFYFKADGTVAVHYRNVRHLVQEVFCNIPVSSRSLTYGPRRVFRCSARSVEIVDNVAHIH